MKKRPAIRPKPQRSTQLSKERLTEMIEEATVDAYGESEQATGWFTMIENNLALPFETKVLGTSVTAARVLLTDDTRIITQAGRQRMD
jgi:hypothetical protein